MTGFFLGVLTQNHDLYAINSFHSAEILLLDVLLRAYAIWQIIIGPCTPNIKHVNQHMPKILKARSVKRIYWKNIMVKILTHNVSTNHPDI
uniref:Chemosensory protein n=1 Tax=Heliothis virescens TaxID=7102 RepID=D2SNP3_HELVI